MGSCLELLIQCGDFFQNVGYIDCKIIVFEVKKDFFTLCKIRLANFESSWLETFALQKVENFNTMLRN
jgi:hypothetical protein